VLEKSVDTTKIDRIAGCIKRDIRECQNFTSRVPADS